MDGNSDTENEKEEVGEVNEKDDGPENVLYDEHTLNLAIEVSKYFFERMGVERLIQEGERLDEEINSVDLLSKYLMKLYGVMKFHSLALTDDGIPTIMFSDNTSSGVEENSQTPLPPTNLLESIDLSDYKLLFYLITNFLEYEKYGYTRPVRQRARQDVGSHFLFYCGKLISETDLIRSIIHLDDYLFLNTIEKEILSSHGSITRVFLVVYYHGRIIFRTKLVGPRDCQYSVFERKAFKKVKKYDIIRMSTSKLCHYFFHNGCVIPTNSKFSFFQKMSRSLDDCEDIIKESTEESTEETKEEQTNENVNNLIVDDVIKISTNLSKNMKFYVPGKNELKTFSRKYQEFVNLLIYACRNMKTSFLFGLSTDVLCYRIIPFFSDYEIFMISHPFLRQMNLCHDIKTRIISRHRVIPPNELEKIEKSIPKDHYFVSSYFYRSICTCSTLFNAITTSKGHEYMTNNSGRFFGEIIKIRMKEIESFEDYVNFKNENVYPMYRRKFRYHIINKTISNLADSASRLLKFIDSKPPEQKLTDSDYLDLRDFVFMIIRRKEEIESPFKLRCVHQILMLLEYLLKKKFLLLLERKDELKRFLLTVHKKRIGLLSSRKHVLSFLVLLCQSCLDRDRVSDFLDFFVVLLYGYIKVFKETVSVAGRRNRGEPNCLSNYCRKKFYEFVQVSLSHMDRISDEMKPLFADVLVYNQWLYKVDERKCSDVIFFCDSMMLPYIRHFLTNKIWIHKKAKTESAHYKLFEVYLHRLIAKFSSFLEFIERNETPAGGFQFDMDEMGESRVTRDSFISTTKRFENLEPHKESVMRKLLSNVPTISHLFDDLLFVFNKIMRRKEDEHTKEEEIIEDDDEESESSTKRRKDQDNTSIIMICQFFLHPCYYRVYEISEEDKKHEISYDFLKEDVKRYRNVSPMRIENPKVDFYQIQKLIVHIIKQKKKFEEYKRKEEKKGNIIAYEKGEVTRTISFILNFIGAIQNLFIRFSQPIDPKFFDDVITFIFPDEMNPHETTFMNRDLAKYAFEYISHAKKIFPEVSMIRNLLCSIEKKKIQDTISQKDDVIKSNDETKILEWKVEMVGMLKRHLWYKHGRRKEKNEEEQEGEDEEEEGNVDLFSIQLSDDRIRSFLMDCLVEKDMIPTDCAMSRYFTEKFIPSIERLESKKKKSNEIDPLLPLDGSGQVDPSSSLSFNMGESTNTEQPQQQDDEFWKTVEKSNGFDEALQSTVFDLPPFYTKRPIKQFIVENILEIFHDVSFLRTFTKVSDVSVLERFIKNLLRLCERRFRPNSCLRIIYLIFPPLWSRVFGTTTKAIVEKRKRLWVTCQSWIFTNFISILNELEKGGFQFLNSDKKIYQLHYGFFMKLLYLIGMFIDENNERQEEQEQEQEQNDLMMMSHEMLERLYHRIQTQILVIIKSKMQGKTEVIFYDTIWMTLSRISKFAYSQHQRQQKSMNNDDLSLITSKSRGYVFNPTKIFRKFTMDRSDRLGESLFTAHFLEVVRVFFMIGQPNEILRFLVSTPYIYHENLNIVSTFIKEVGNLYNDTLKILASHTWFIRLLLNVNGNEQPEYDIKMTETKAHFIRTEFFEKILCQSEQNGMMVKFHTLFLMKKYYSTQRNVNTSDLHQINKLVEHSIQKKRNWRDESVIKTIRVEYYVKYHPYKFHLIFKDEEEINNFERYDYLLSTKERGGFSSSSSYRRRRVEVFDKSRSEEEEGPKVEEDEEVIDFSMKTSGLEGLFVKGKEISSNDDDDSFRPKFRSFRKGRENVCSIISEEEDEEKNEESEKIKKKEEMKKQEKDDDVNIVSNSTTFDFDFSGSKEQETSDVFSSNIFDFSGNTESVFDGKNEEVKSDAKSDSKLWKTNEKDEKKKDDDDDDDIFYF